MPKWTVMIFMGADTIDGNVPMGPAAEADLEEIRSIDGCPGLRVFVQLHQTNKVPLRYYFGEPALGIASKTPIPEATPGDALIPFVRDSLKAVSHDKSDYSMLVLWGHAYDFAFGRARTRTGEIDAIDFVELSDKLNAFQALVAQQLGYGGQRPKLDIVGFDACDAATLELAYQLRPYAKFLLASQIAIPIPGWPYDRVLDRIAHPKGDVMSPPELGSYIVRRFCESYEPEDPVSLTLINLAKLRDARRSATVLALALATVIGRAGPRDRIMELFQRSQTAPGRPFVDAADLCLNLVRESGNALVAVAARALGNQLLAPRPPLVGESDGVGEGGSKRPLVTEFGRNAGELARLNGISLYAPHVAPENDGSAVRVIYDNFSLAQKTRWGRLVHALADVG